MWDFVSTNSARRGILSTEQRWPSWNQLLLYETIKWHTFTLKYTCCCTCTHVCTCKGLFTQCDSFRMRLGCVDVICCDCDITVTLVCATSYMEWASYAFCKIAMCDSNMYLYRSQSHCVNNFTKSHVKKRIKKRCRLQKESYRVNEP